MTRLVAAAAAVALIAAPTPAGSRPAGEQPAQFVARLYAVYGADSPWWGSSSDRKAAAFQKRVYVEFYDPVFVKLMNDNDSLAAAKNAGQDLDYDPICQCQDSGGTYRYVSGEANGGFYDAKVTDNAADRTPWTVVLKKMRGGWRIFDVIDETGSVRTWLGQHNACLRAATSEKQAGACVS